MKLAHDDGGSGPVVVLLHGFPLSRAMWQHQRKAIESTHRLIAPDLRGHGESAAPEGVYSMDAMADDVVELLDELRIDQPIVLGGLSMGGYVALSLVCRYPRRVRALMLIDTRAAADTPEAARLREAAAQSVLQANHARSIIETMVPRLFGKSTLEQHPERVGPILAEMEKTSAQGVAGALRGMARRPDRRAELASIKVPTLVMVGQDDVISPVADAREIAEALPDARLEVIPASGHLAPYENPSTANEAMLRFLNNLGKN
jgi:pimeloyl-ACP methyl ester carboxylesterase